MSNAAIITPAPPLPIRVEIPAETDCTPDLRALPNSAGVFALEDGEGRTLGLSVTANLRRRVRARLSPPDDDAPPSRRIDYRGVVRVVRAVPVGSPFEADWAYLQLARSRLPQMHPRLLDRWRGWFIHCDPDAPFPRFVRMAAPAGAGAPRTAPGGVRLGPFADRHAVQRAIELVEDLFDLCRYHHILVEAPNGAACAYKEMGKCPAPCDGSITMDDYRGAVRAAVDFLDAPIEAGLAALEVRMRSASAALDFERAERERLRLEAAHRLARPPFRSIARLERFRYLAVLPSEDDSHARLVLIAGGRIEPWLDLRSDAAREVIEEVGRAADSRLRAPALEKMTDDRADDLMQNIGLVCWHLFRPRSESQQGESPQGESPQGEFIAMGEAIDPERLAAAIDRLGSSHQEKRSPIPEYE